MKDKISRRNLLKKMAGVTGAVGLSLLGLDLDPRLQDTASAAPFRQTGGNRLFFPVVMNQPVSQAYNPNSPAQPQRLIFIHHSVGQAWLADNYGSLGIALQDNNYFVSDTNYGWGPLYPGGGTIGDYTDIGNWYDWFLSPRRDTYLMGENNIAGLYNEYRQNCAYSRSNNPDPSGENKIILYKSCFPNSIIYGNPSDPPTTGNNPLYSKPAATPEMTVGNIKGLYNALLLYFAQRLDKLFIVITAPPLVESATNPSQAANARAVNTWLVRDWLATYSHKNVAVIDFYNVLTSNGGSPSINDAYNPTGNHHLFRDNKIDHINDQGSNFNVYPTLDSHPTAAGDQKATAELIPLINIAYNRWKT